MGLLTTAQAAEILGLDQSRVRHFILEGRLRAEKYGKTWLIREAVLTRFQEQQRPAGRPKQIA